MRSVAVVVEEADLLLETSVEALLEALLEAEAMFIRDLKPTLNKQKDSYKLTLFG